MSRVAHIKKTGKKPRSSNARRRLTPETMMLLRQFFFGTSLLLLVVGLLTGIWYGTRVEALTIDEVTVSGGETISHSEIESIVTDTLDGTYFKLIPRQFAWLYPHTDILQNITANQRVQTVQVERVSGKHLQVRLTEFIPAALWCQEESLQGCLFIDETGYAFTVAPQLTGGSLVRYVTLGQAPERGQRPVAVADLAAITWFTSALQEELGWAVSQVEIDSAGDVFYGLANRSELKVAVATDPATIYANLATVLESNDFSGLQPGDFQYIDLRFGNKVFVNREAWETATSTDAIMAEVDVPLSPPEAALAVPVIEGVDVSVETEPVAPADPDLDSDFESEPVGEEEVALASNDEAVATTSTSTETASSSAESE